MALFHTSFNTFDIVGIAGELTINVLPSVSPEMTKLVNDVPDRDLVLDLSKVNAVDSSALRLFINLHKKLQSQNRCFYLLNPSETVHQAISNTNLDKVLSIVPDVAELDNRITEAYINRYVPFSHEHDGIRQLDLRCEICGSSRVAGYLVDKRDYEWKWDDDNPFPACTVKQTGGPFDYFAVLPIVCKDCLMCSIDLSRFNVVDDRKTAYPADIKENMKLLLSKSIKKRKKMLESAGIAHDTIFEHPRQKNILYHLFLLAEECTRTTAIKKGSASSFHVGFLNYLAIKYADKEQIARHIENSRTWLTKAITDDIFMTEVNRAQCYFILVVGMLNLEKEKEASAVYELFTRMIESLPQTMPGKGIDNPVFWYEQCGRIREKIVGSDSSVPES